MTSPRWLEKLRAGLTGRFWLPCALCGYEHSGREWTKDDTPVVIVAGDRGTVGQVGKGICPRCSARLRDRDPDFAAGHRLRAVAITPEVAKDVWEAVLNDGRRVEWKEARTGC